MLLFSAAGVSNAADKPVIKTEIDMINYSIGYQVGNKLNSQGIELNPEVLLQGVRDAQQKNTPLITQEQMDSTLLHFKQQGNAGPKELKPLTPAEYRKASAAFLEKNAGLKGVTVLPSGVQYKILKAGSGKKPALTDDVTVHYRITRVDGKEIANTYAGGKPRTYLLSKAMPGLQEVLPLMAEGSKWQIVLPTATVTGGREPMDDKGAIIYDMELLSVMPASKSELDTDSTSKMKPGQ